MKLLEKKGTREAGPAACGDRGLFNLLKPYKKGEGEKITSKKKKKIKQSKTIISQKQKGDKKRGQKKKKKAQVAQLVERNFEGV